MKVALVHDYIRELGGAERVLRVLCDMYPEAPIHVAFADRNSSAYQKFKDRTIVESPLGKILKIGKLYSPLRFLTPWVWGSFDLSKYDLVITSASWYITKGFRIGKNTKVICYCHTPPRNLYGYQTSIKWGGVEWRKFPPAIIYAAVVNHFLRVFDFRTAQLPNREDRIIRAGVDEFVANSRNVAQRIRKFYRRESAVIYPPVKVEEIIKKTRTCNKEGYYLIVCRLADGKGLEEAAIAAKELGVSLKIAGKGYGFSDIEERLKRLSGDRVELLGEVSDDKVWELYAKAKGFIALAKNEDFGMTVVEAMAAGTGVVALNSGGFKESLVDGVTAAMIGGTSVKKIEVGIRRLEKINPKREELITQARKFSKERFIEQMKKIVTETMK